ncbi:MAG: biotin transporter BioY [Deltaproteobacteria bacterium]|nr:biotin transporter BioY [Deltaproteobacteria bacterium]
MKPGKTRAAAQDLPSLESVRNMVLASLLAALMAAGAWIAVPVGPVPVVLQNMFVLLAGLLLGPRWGAASVAVYLLAGLAGLPVFSGGGGGPGHFLGPTGGYLVAYLPAVWLVGLLSNAGGRVQDANHRPGRAMAMDVLAMAVGMILVYALGVARLQAVTRLPWNRAVALGMLPFLPGDALKIAAAAAIARMARPLLGRENAPAPGPHG